MDVMDVRSRRKSWHCLAVFAASKRRSSGPWLEVRYGSVLETNNERGVLP
jgi:hypothetical protein